MTPPFQLDDENLSETVRLEHRVLDLRRLPMQRNLKLRHRAAMSARRYLDANGFIDIETPALYKSTPEGAREFLVPSRIHHGQFYALPQSPQLFKQMLMMAGFDRYYQIVKCFRDEDLRADRQPEFTQIDVETSFLSELEIRELMEGLVHTMFKDVLDVELPNPFPIMTFGDAMRDYGSDKPDLRVPLKLTELTDVMKAVDFKLFRAAADLPERARRGAQRSGRRDALAQGNRRLHDVREDLRRGRPRLHQGQRRLQAKRGRPAVADRQVPDARSVERRSSSAPVPSPATSSSSAPIARRSSTTRWVRCAPRSATNAASRSRAGSRCGSSTSRCSSTTRINKTWAARHHPFTAPKDGHEELFSTDPGATLAKAYDVVLNGWEIGGGSVRIHKQDVQAKVFEALRISPEDQRRKFGFLLDALSYGAPPHGGIAFGFDRLTAMMAGVDQIRDVIAFPKTQRGQDLLVGAPSPATEAQLRDLHIKVRPSDAVKTA